MGDGLRLIVFVEEEVFLAKTGTKRPLAICHRRRDVDQLDAALEPETVARLRRRLLRADRRQRARDRDGEGNAAVLARLPMVVSFGGPISQVLTF